MDAKKEWAMIDGMMNGAFDEDNWVTINGTHVLIGEGGEIKGGPAALKNYKKGEKASGSKTGEKKGSGTSTEVQKQIDYVNGLLHPGQSYSMHLEDVPGGIASFSKELEKNGFTTKIESYGEGGKYKDLVITRPADSGKAKKKIEFDHPEGADKVKGYVGNERVAELAEKAIKKKGDEGLHPGYELDRIDSITVFPPDDDYKTDGSQLIVSYTATNKTSGKTEQFEAHPYVKAYSGSKSASKSTKEGTTNKELFTSLAPDQLDRNLKKVLPVGATLTNKETGEEWYVAKHFGDNGVGRERNSVYMVRSELKENGQKNITQSKGLRYFPSQLKKDFTVDTSAEEMELVLDMMAGEYDLPRKEK